MLRIYFIVFILISFLFSQNNSTFNKKIQALTLDNDLMLYNLIVENNGKVIEFENIKNKDLSNINFTNQVILIGERHENKVSRKIVPIVDYLLENYPIYGIGMEGQHFGEINLTDKKIFIDLYINELNKYLKNSEKISTNKSNDELNKILCNKYASGHTFSYMVKSALECDGKNAYLKYYDDNLVFGLENNETIIKKDLDNQMRYDGFFYQIFLDFKDMNKNEFINYSVDNIDTMFNYFSNIEIGLYESYQKSLFLPLIKISALELLMIRYDFDFEEINRFDKIMKKKKNMFPLSSNIKLDNKSFEDLKKIAYQKKIIYHEIITIQIVRQRRNYDFYNNIKRYLTIIKNKHIKNDLMKKKYFSNIKDVNYMNILSFYKDKKLLIAIVGCNHIEGVDRLLKEDNISVISIDFGGCF